jgi:hypothetical protein
MAVAAALIVAVAIIAHQQLPVIIYKLGLVVAAGVVGYFVDRTAFPYARPHIYLRYDREGAESDRLLIAATLRRALIIAAAMLAVGLGL